MPTPIEEELLKRNEPKKQVKQYNVVERFKEVARRAERPKPISESQPVTPDPTRPGASMSIPRDFYGRKKDVNLSNGK
jgi:hypothetical protein